MNSYQFVALNKEKQKIKGTLDASSVDELRKIISFHDYYLVKYKLAKKKERSFIEKNVKTKHIKELCVNFTMLLRTGQNLIKVVDLLDSTCRNKGIKEFLQYTKVELENGKSLTGCVRKYKKYFSKMFISMVEIGEKTSSLEKVFSYLAKYYEENEKIKSKIVNAMFYPLILLLLSIVVFFVMSVLVLPMYSDIFKDNMLELPIYTKIIFMISGFIKNNLLFVVLGLILIVLVLILILSSKTGKKSLLFILSKIIGIKYAFKLINLFTISRSLEIMLSNSLTISDSIDTLVSSINDFSLIKKLKWISDEIKRGEKVSKAFSTVNYFPTLFCEMIKNGENANELEIEMRNASNYYFNKLINFLSKVSVFIEPIMIILISLFVGGLMFAIFMPMLNLLSAFS